MKKGNKYRWLWITLIVLIICGIAGTVLAGIQFKNMGNRTYASASLQFSFESAGEGKAPNGYPFDVKRINSDDVINSALETSGLQDTYTADQIRENLSVTAVYPEDIVKRMTSYTSILDAGADQQAELADYQATIYSVKLYSDFDTSISSEKLTELLNNLLTAYRNDFAKTGGPSLSRTDPIANLEEYDYTQQLTAISEASKQQSSYAKEMAEEAPNFRKDGMSFDDIVTRYENLDSDIDRLNASITLNALSKDRERLQKQYEMELRSLNRELESKQEELNRIGEMVSSYEKDGIIYVSTSGSLQKVSSNASDTYDKLVAKRKELTDRITAINADIMKYQAFLADLTANSNKDTTKETTQNTETSEGTEAVKDTETATNSETIKTTDTTEETVSTSVELTDEEAARMAKDVEQKLQNLTNKKNTITADFTAMLNAYARQEISPQTVSVTALKYIAPTFLSGEFIVKVIKTAGPFCAVGLIICLLFIIISRRKEEKEKA